MDAILGVHVAVGSASCVFRGLQDRCADLNQAKPCRPEGGSFGGPHDGGPAGCGLAIETGIQPEPSTLGVDAGQIPRQGASQIEFSDLVGFADKLERLVVRQSCAVKKFHPGFGQFAGRDVDVLLIPAFNVPLACNQAAALTIAKTTSAQMKRSDHRRRRRRRDCAPWAEG
jgi:hypothetical protein